MLGFHVAGLACFCAEHVEMTSRNGGLSLVHPDLSARQRVAPDLNLLVFHLPPNPVPLCLDMAASSIRFVDISSHGHC